MEIQFKNNVRIICDLEIGDTVQTVGMGYKYDGSLWVIIDMVYEPNNSSSGFLVKINGYDNFIDSDYVTKIK